MPPKDHDDPGGRACSEHSGIEARQDAADRRITGLETTQDKIFEKLDKLVANSMRRVSPGTVTVISILSSTVVGLAVALLKK